MSDDKPDRALKDDGDVPANVYESAVKGRQDFRNALRETREQLAACELKAGEYEKCLETCLHDYNLSDTEFAEGEWTNAPMRKIISEVLAAHRRGGEDG